jgi:hypothetical protein
MRPAVTPKPQLQVSRQFVASQSRIFNQAFTNQAVEAPDKPALKNNHLRVAPIDEEYLAKGEGLDHVSRKEDFLFEPGMQPVQSDCRVQLCRACRVIIAGARLRSADRKLDLSFS